jgi:hypothetical protein
MSGDLQHFRTLRRGRSVEVWSETAGSTVAEGPEHGRVSSAVDQGVWGDRGAPRSEAFRADLAWLSRPPVAYWPTARLESRVVRLVLRSPVRTLSPAQALVAWVAISGLRLILPVVVTTAAGAWSGAPGWRWLAIAALVAAFDVRAFGHMHDSSALEGFEALPAVLDRDEDMHELVRFARRGLRFRVIVPGAACVALAILSACALLAPGELRAVHVGSLTMLALILYEFGEAVVGSILVFAPFVLKEAHYSHRLSWLSPLDSPPVQQMLHSWGRAILMLGWSIALYFVIAVVLLEPDSITLLLAPIAGFTLVSIVVTVGGLVGMRSGVRSIVHLTRDRSLQRLQRRIDEFEPRLEVLTPAEWRQLEGFIATYEAVRDAPTSPTGEQTLGKAVGALAIPAVGFLLAVLAEVYTERLLEQILS